MTLAYKCEKKRAHHISYLTHKWIQGEKAANTRACLRCHSVCEFMTSHRPEAYVDNKIVTTKMAEYYLLVYKNSSKDCSSALFESFLAQPPVRQEELNS